MKNKHYRFSRRVKLLRHWKKHWSANPDLMESYRQAATQRSAEIRNRRNENLKNLIMTWPPLMTSEEFKGYLKTLADDIIADGRRKYHPDSMRRRLAGNQWVTFDIVIGRWVNRIRPN